jgi:hypothetical protein
MTFTPEQVADLHGLVMSLGVFVIMFLGIKIMDVIFKLGG